MALNFEDFVRHFQRHVPEAVILRHVAFGTVSVTCEDGIPSFNDVSDALSRGSYEVAVWAVLSHVQDHIVVCTRQAWPKMANNIAVPQVALQGRLLRAWFGSETEVVIDIGTFAV